MRDKIFIQELAIKTRIGIFDWERKIKQTVLIDLEFPTNIRKAAKSDKISDTIDYKKISKHVISLVAKSEFFLVEALAEEIAASLLKDFKLSELTLRLSKPGALRGSKNVGLEITRKKGRK